jgi:hypothetical protein
MIVYVNLLDFSTSALDFIPANVSDQSTGFFGIGSGGQSPVPHRESPCSVPGQFIWDLW